MKDFEALRPFLAAAANAVIPPDENSPGGWEGGIERYLAAAWNTDLSWAKPALNTLAVAFQELRRGSAEQAATEHILSQLSENERTAAAIKTLIRICREGYYGGTTARPPAGWNLLNFDPWPFASTPGQESGPNSTSLHHLRQSYDVVIIGSGPGGGVAARVLAESGASVLLIERSREHTDADLRGDHLHGKRMALYSPLAGPGIGNPRSVVEPDGREWTVDGDSSGDSWGLNAMVLGGGTRLWQGMAWRFLPEDFSMASDYGVPAGSSLADWPIGYSEMSSAYAWAERELGVSGATGSLTARMPGHPGYPMPPLQGDPTRIVLGAAANRLGWKHGPIPFAINSIPRAGRPACSACQQCMGHSCPTGAKNGSHNTFIPAALKTGNCDLLTGSQAVRIIHSNGQATAVEIVTESDGEDSRFQIGCGRVMVAAGSVETPRLLLASNLGNEHVGRHLQGHVVTLQAGISPAPVPTFRGPGHSVATFDFVHDRKTIGGGVLFDAFAPYPLQLAEWADHFEAPAWGAGHKNWLRGSVGHILGTMSMGQEVPHPGSRVELDPVLRDRRGVPAARIYRTTHPETLRNRDYLNSRSRDWLDSAGCSEIVDIFKELPGQVPAQRSPAGEHSAGTVRMGTDPSSSAADPEGRVWGTANVYVSDGSLHPTNGSVNPTLTLIANAYRIAAILTRNC
ncbi:GMC oxidoreductase [Paenarthrobacter sp. TYUT067]|uniref:GMC family oxidoreductase n=1 Tax=Paenarthrobacter sp. TYUT067 TaxID=2926245 RepID=UPI00202E5526|nr:GMC oxidoreductase [Paenarthrobacter sp. TYUT067]MCM0616848.1 GMC oxidoreductase [Paenarthrobacter sp. TYUT067]